MSKAWRMRTFLAFFRKEDGMARTEDFLVLLVMSKIRKRTKERGLYSIGSVDPRKFSQWREGHHQTCPRKKTGNRNVYQKLEGQRRLVEGFYSPDKTQGGLRRSAE